MDDENAEQRVHLGYLLISNPGISILHLVSQSVNRPIRWQGSAMREAVLAELWNPIRKNQDHSVSPLIQVPKMSLHHYSCQRIGYRTKEVVESPSSNKGTLKGRLLPGAAIGLAAYALANVLCTLSTTSLSLVQSKLAPRHSASLATSVIAPVVLIRHQRANSRFWARTPPITPPPP